MDEHGRSSHTYKPVTSSTCDKPLRSSQSLNNRKPEEDVRCVCTHCPLQSIQRPRWTQVLLQSHWWPGFWCHRERRFLCCGRPVWTRPWSRCSSPHQSPSVSTTHSSAGLGRFSPGSAVAEEMNPKTWIINKLWPRRSLWLKACPVLVFSTGTRTRTPTVGLVVYRTVI